MHESNVSSDLYINEDNGTPNDESNEREFYIAPDGTQWKIVHTSTNPPERYSKQNVMHQIPGTTAYAKKFIKAENVLSTSSLFIDKKITQQIKEYTETEAKCVLQTNWTVMIDDLPKHSLEFYMLEV